MPRIFADAFYNLKDLGFLSCWLLALHFALRLARSPRVPTALAAGAAAALAVDVRVAGLLLAAFTLATGVRPGAWLRGPGARAVAYAASLAAVMIALWPRLWRNPALELWRALENNRRFLYNSAVWYLGRSVRAHELPWHYLPVWIAVTVPLATLVLAPAGLFAALCDPRATLRAAVPADAAFLALPAAPLAAVVIFHSPIYDGWRHLYFVAPSIAWFAVAGFARLGSPESAADGGAWRRRLATGALALSLAPVAVWMVRHHPYQNLYFNRIAGPDAAAAKARFDYDYHGLAYREAYERLLRRDSAPSIRVAPANDAAEFTVKMLPPADRTRLSFTGEYPSADYFIGNYRWNARGYYFRHIDLERVECVAVDDACAVGVYRVHPPGSLGATADH